MSTDIEISDLVVRYGDVVAVEGFDMYVPEGALTVLLGPSGCGKSTVLGSVAGTIEPSAGRIRIGDALVVDVEDKLRVPPSKRHLGMVFQSYALWPHMSVIKNVAYPLARAGVAKREREEAALSTLKLVRCEEFAERLPGELSGGQQQRVALARAIVDEPTCVLFDEPLSNLDAGLRRALREEIRALQLRIGGTGLYVTHDQEEALGIGDEVAVMRAGRVVQVGPPDSVYRAPASPYVAKFLGANVVRGTFDSYDGDLGYATTPFGRLCSSSAPGFSSGQSVVVGVHPENTRIEARSESEATIEVVSFVGKRWEYVLSLDSGRNGSEGTRMHAFNGSRLMAIERGAPVTAAADPDNVWFFDGSDQDDALQLYTGVGSSDETAMVDESHG